MTSAEYNRIREMIESTFRQDMAALERVWFRVNGCNPPDSVVALAKPLADEEAPVARDAGLPQSAKKKIGGRKLGWARHRAKKAGNDPDKMTDEELQQFVK